MAIFKTYHKVIRVLPDPDYFYIENLYNGSNTLTFNTSSGLQATEFQYSTDKNNWNDVDLTTTSHTITLNALNDKVYFRAKGVIRTNSAYINSFHCANNYKAGGCLLSLIDYSDIDSITSIPDYAFSRFLYYEKNYTYNTQLIACDCNIGNATVVGEFAFSSFCERCSNLTTMPDFSGIVTCGYSSFDNSFFSCSKLTSFVDFSSLETVSYNSFHYAFNGTKITGIDFSNLTTNTRASEKPVNSGLFYNAFVNTDITSVSFPKFADPGYSAFSYAFHNCTSLIEADLRGVTTLRASSSQYDNSDTLYNTFSGCSNLTTVYYPNVSSYGTNTSRYWLNNVSTYGVIHKPSTVILPTDSPSGVPTGWTTIDY